ncbi:hypothetical protein JTB14_035977 [Gonioctena quinquepunctata]|nr:hypothetical protein JTB14_035977 [Gonioctena quinquepunctata]
MTFLKQKKEKFSADGGVGIHKREVPRLPNKALANLHVRKIHCVFCGLKDIKLGALDGSNISVSRISIKKGVFNHKEFTILSLEEDNQISQIEAGSFVGMEAIYFEWE